MNQRLEDLYWTRGRARHGRTASTRRRFPELPLLVMIVDQHITLRRDRGDPLDQRGPAGSRPRACSTSTSVRRWPRSAGARGRRHRRIARRHRRARHQQRPAPVAVQCGTRCRRCRPRDRRSRGEPPRSGRRPLRLTSDGDPVVIAEVRPTSTSTKPIERSNAETAAPWPVPISSTSHLSVPATRSNT